MAEHVWSVLCSLSMIDIDTKIISLFQAFESLHVPTRDQEALDAALAKGDQVAFPIQMELVSWWARSDFDKPETASVRLVTVFPSGERFYQPSSSTIDLETVRSLHHRIKFSNFPFRGMGFYYLVIEKLIAQPDTWQPVARVPLQVVAEQVEKIAEVKSGATSPELPSGPTPAAPPGSSSPPGPSRPSHRRASRAQRPRGSS